MQKDLMIIVLLLIAVSVTGLFLFASNEFSSSHGHMGQEAQTVRTAELLLFAVPLAISVAIAIYAVTFPEIKKSAAATTQSAQPQVENKQALDAILKVLNEDERKVVQALSDSEKGSLLQKEIGWKTKLSRVKTHRVVARLASRDIVRVEKQVNTNKVTLAEWISKNEE